MCVCVYLCVYVLYVVCSVTMHGGMLVGIVVTGWNTCSTYSTHSGRLPYLHLAVCFASIYQNLYCVAVTLYDYTFLLATIVEGVVLRHSIFVFETAWLYIFNYFVPVPLHFDLHITYIT